MATLLDGVNAVLKRVNIIKGETGEITSLSQSTIQHEIDVCVQCWNEVITELYSATRLPHPQELKSANITLLSGEREYDLPNDLVVIRFPLMENTNGYYIFEWEPGFEDLRQHQQIPSNWLGRPNFACINPKNNKLYMDYIPTSQESGLIYDLIYDRELLMSSSTDAFPFNNTVYTSLIPCVAERWKLDQRKSFSSEIYKKMLGQAGRYLMQKPNSQSYLPKRV